LIHDGGAVSYPWPGHIRALANVTERGAIFSSGLTLVVEELLRPDIPAAIGPRPAPETLEGIERAHIAAILEACHWQIKGKGQAADRFGLNPSTLRSRMKKLGITRPGAS
jgi:formate hydrogenlyase transcriptional activator